MSHPFCTRHRSHYCPCVRPDIYRGKGELERARAEWDEWLECERRGERYIWRGRKK